MATPEHLQGRLRMAILTKGELDNHTWNSFKSQDPKTDDEIIAGMLTRLERTAIFNVVQTVQVYNNKTNELLKTYTTKTDHA